MTITEQPRAGASAAPVATRPDPPAAGSGATRGRWWTLAVVLAALSPFAIGAVQILRRGFPPGALFGDRAILALTAGDAFHAPVLLGPYSRFFWHHPGPMYFYVLDAWSRLFGHGTTALVLGATAIDVAGAVGILYLAHRRGGRPLLVWASLLLTTYLVAIDPVPFDIWNPSVTLLPFVALLLLAWSVTCRDWWAMPWFALVGSFVVQTHVGLAPPVAAAVGFCVVVAWRQRRRAAEPLGERERATVGRAALASLVVAVVAWLPPLVQELTGREGNLSALLRFFTKGGSPHPLSDGLTHAGLQATLGLRSLFEPVALRTDYHQGLAVGVLVTAAAFVGALVLARHVRATDTLLLGGLVVVELLAGVYAITRIEGPIQFYLVQWVSGVGFVLWLVVGKAVIDAARARWSARWSMAPPSRTLVRAGVVLVALLVCASAVRAFPSGAGLVNEDLDVPNNRDLFGYVPTRQLLVATRPGQTVVLQPDSVTSWEVLAADALLLRQHGRTVRVVATNETRLLFDDSLLVSRAAATPRAGRQVLAFGDRLPRRFTDSTYVADQGRWTIVTVHRR